MLYTAMILGNPLMLPNWNGFILDIPGKPGTPTLEDWDVDRVDLKWEAPKNTGGAPITGYVIEKKEKLSANWDEVLTTNVIILFLLRLWRVFRTDFWRFVFCRLLTRRLQWRAWKKATLISSVFVPSTRLVPVNTASRRSRTSPRPGTVSSRNPPNWVYRASY